MRGMCPDIGETTLSQVQMIFRLTSTRASTPTKDPILTKASVVYAQSTRTQTRRTNQLPSPNPENRTMITSQLFLFGGTRYALPHPPNFPPHQIRLHSTDLSASAWTAADWTASDDRVRGGSSQVPSPPPSPGPDLSTKASIHLLTTPLLYSPVLPHSQTRLLHRPFPRHPRHHDPRRRGLRLAAHRDVEPRVGPLRLRWDNARCRERGREDVYVYCQG